MSEAPKMNEQEREQEQEIEVRTDIEAGWQLERRKKIIADRDELIAFYKDQIEEVKADAEWKLGFVERALRAFFNTRPHQKTKTQEYVKLPGGKLILKVQNPEYEYKKNQAETIEWLKQNGMSEYVKVKEELDWDSLKKVTGTVDGRIVTGDGEFIPGITVTERDPKFTIEQ